MVSGRLPARTNVDDFADQRVTAHCRRDLLEALAKCAGTEEHRLIGAADRVNVSLGMTLPAQAHDIEPDQIGERSLRGPERDDVGAHAGESDDHRPFADPHELAHGGLATEHHVVADAHMPAKHDIVGERHSVADLAIVRHMRTRPSGSSGCRLR